MELQCSFCGLLLSSNARVALIGEGREARVALEFSTLMLQTSEHLAREHSRVFHDEVAPVMTIAGQVAVLRLMKLTDGELKQMYQVYSDHLVRLAAGDSVSELIQAAAQASVVAPQNQA